jgi:hypothetical protein
MEVERRGFLLREKASSAYDVELDSRLLERWLETVLGNQEWERQLAEAYEQEKSLQAELSKVRSWAQDLAHERDEAQHAFEKALLGPLEAWAADLEKGFAEARVGIAAKLGDLDSLVQSVEAERRVWRALARSHADGIPRQTAGQPDYRVGWRRLGRWKRVLMVRPGVRLVGLTGAVLLLLLLIWSQLRPVVAPDLGQISPQSGKPAATTEQRSRR